MKDIREIILGGEELVELKPRRAVLYDYEIQAWTGS